MVDKLFYVCMLVCMASVYLCDTVCSFVSVSMYDVCCISLSGLLSVCEYV